MITVKATYGFEPDEYGDPLEWWFTVYSNSGEAKNYIQGSQEENRKNVEEFINWVRGKHPDEEIIDCTGTC